MLTQLVPYVGLAAFTLVVPITLAILGVLFFVTLSYLEVIQLYTKAGGSYVVARDNFGPKVAQIAAVALLIDYTVTVAVQTSAGTAALTSAVPSLANTVDTVAITVGVVAAAPVRQPARHPRGGQLLRRPDLLLHLLAGVGDHLRATSRRRSARCTRSRSRRPTRSTAGRSAHRVSGWLMGLAFISLLRSFANGGSSLTGLEAISNGVSSFRRPEAKHARQTLVVMSSMLGVPRPRRRRCWPGGPTPCPTPSARPTVVSQEVKAVFGTSGVGHLLFYVVQLATMLILYTGGNTSFNGFPFLASFVAGDRFLPRQLTQRGHRLAFSNGILVLAGVAIALVLVFKAQVNGLVALYAIGVFTGFTMAGAGMVKHHLTARKGALAPQRGVNGFSAFLSFSRRADLRRGEVQGGRLGHLRGRPAPLLRADPAAPPVRVEDEHARVGRDGGDRGARPAAPRRRRPRRPPRHGDGARARSTPGHCRPTTCGRCTSTSTPRRRRELEQEWSRLGLARLPLDIIECPDRRLGRAAIELVADATLDGDTECTVLLPRRGYARVLAALPARPHGRQDRRRPRPGAPRRAPPSCPSTWAAASVSGCAPTAGRCSGRAGPASAGRPGRAAVEPDGRTGVDRMGRRDGPRRPATRCSRPTATLAQRAGATTPIAGVRRASGSGWPAGSSRCGCSRGRAPRTSNASSATGRAASCSSSRAGRRSRGSSRGPGWWPRGWWARGAAGRPCSTPRSSWCRGPDQRPGRA